MLEFQRASQARENGATGAPVAERRQVTVLFADMVGYTPIAERLGEEGTYDLMQSIFAIMARAVRERGGLVQDFTGDGIMAVFGVPVALEDATLRACRAALAIQERLAASATDLEFKHGVRPQMRVGINTGPVVVGQIESGRPSVSGDTVNFAARLQTLAGPGTVVVSEAAHRLVQGLVESTFAGEHAIKGKSDMQKVYRVDGVRQGAARFDAALSLGLTTYVGRTEELRTLEECFEESARGLRVLDVVGEPGMGKSRLLHEFRGRLPKQRASVLSGNCSPDGKTTPFLAFIDVVRGAFRVAAGEAEDAVARKLDDGLMVLGLRSSENLSLLLNLLGLKVPEGALKGLDGTLIGLRTRDLLQGLMQARCRLSPVVLLLEDLHWMDGVSEEVVGKIIGGETALPLLIVHTRRPEHRPPWADGQRARTLSLEPLSAAETANIVRARLGAVALPDGLAKLVAEKVDGNALFAEEIASFLVERGVVRRTPAGLEYDAATVAQALPTSVQSLLTARVDQLEPADRALLQAAAVIGRSFDSDLLGAVTVVPSGVEPRLAAMQALDLVYRDDKTAEYAFKHALVRDALYASLLSGPRAALHLKAAEAIEGRSHNRLSEMAEVLAHHFEVANNTEKALVYYLMAASKSISMYSLGDARLYFSKFEVLMRKFPQRVSEDQFLDFVAGHALILNLSYDLRASLKFFEEHNSRLLAAGANSRAIAARHHQVVALLYSARFEEAEAAQDLLNEMTDASCRHGCLAYRNASLFFLRAVHFRGKIGEENELETELEAARLDGNIYLESMLRFSIAWAAIHEGRLSDARTIANKLMEVGEQVDDPRARGFGRALLCWANIIAGDYEAALACSRAISSDAITPYDRLNGESGKACALILLRRLDEGWATLHSLRQEAVREGRLYQLAGADMAYGVGLALRGDLGQGIEYIQTSIIHRDSEGYHSAADWSRLGLAEFYLEILYSKETPPLGFIVRNIVSLLKIKLFGKRDILNMLQIATKNKQLTIGNAIRGKISFLYGMYYKGSKKKKMALQHLQQARELIAAENTPLLLGKIEAMLAELS